MSNETIRSSDPNVASAARNPALAAALREMEASKNRSPWRKWLFICGMSVLALLLISAGAWAIKLKLDANAKARLLASIQEDPRKMRDAVDAGKITREEGREAMQTMFEQRMDKQMDDYFALKTPADRTKYLDKLIDEQEARRKEWEQRAATQPSTRPWRRPTTQSTTQPTTRPNRPFDPTRQLDRVQGGNPVRKAQRAEFMAAMRQRMMQRGIQPGRGGGWGGGGRGPGGGGGRGGR